MYSPIQLKRKSIGIEQREFAARLGIPVRSYRRYEVPATSSDHQIPDAVTAIKIADALGVKDLRELWGFESSASLQNRR